MSGLARACPTTTTPTITLHSTTSLLPLDTKECVRSCLRRVWLCIITSALTLTLTLAKNGGHAAASTAALRQHIAARPDHDQLPLAAKKEPAAEVEEVPPFALLDVRVGKIVKAWAHPESEKLWCEQVDVGEKDEEGNVVPREIASGLRAYYPT